VRDGATRMVAPQNFCAGRKRMGLFRALFFLTPTYKLTFILQVGGIWGVC
jgi:hypothetical protein